MKVFEPSILPAKGPPLPARKGAHRSHDVNSVSWIAPALGAQNLLGGREPWGLKPQRNPLGVSRLLGAPGRREDLDLL
jgi:hypothetical protein